eukprot:tig00020943_g16331.t1
MPPPQRVRPEPPQAPPRALPGVQAPPRSALEMIPRPTERNVRAAAAAIRGGRGRGAPGAGLFGSVTGPPGVQPREETPKEEIVDYFPSEEMNQTVLSIRQKLRRVEGAPRGDVGAGLPRQPTSSSSPAPAPAPTPVSAFSPEPSPTGSSSSSAPTAPPLYPSMAPDLFGAPLPPSAAPYARRFEAEYDVDVPLPSSSPHAYPPDFHASAPAPAPAPPLRPASDTAARPGGAAPLPSGPPVRRAPDGRRRI